MTEKKHIECIGNEVK